MANSALHEIFGTRMWDFVPSALHGYKNTIEENISARLPFIKKEERTDRPFMLSSKTGFSERTYVGETQYLNFDKLEEEDKVINVIDIQGAILRNGDACSYGSKNHRDIIKRAANDGHTIGHIILVDSPGGSPYAKYDYEDAINYARSKGQPVIGLVDGMACSAGYAPMAMCDEVYAVGLHDQVGCIGTMAAFYINKDGDENAITKERYVEKYATGSPYKNKEYRDVAEGNDDELQKEIDELADDYKGMVAKYRPQSTEEQRKGATYNAGDVIGTMIDGQGTLETCIARILELTGNNKRPASSASPSGESHTPSGESTRKESQTNTVAGDNKNNFNSNEKMKEYPKIMAALGLNALVSDKDNGLYFTESMADILTEFVGKAENTESTLNAKLQEIAQLNANIEQLKKDHAQALETLTSAHATELANLSATHKKEVDELNGQLETANGQIAAKDAEIKELSEAATKAPTPQDPPKENSVGGKQQADFSVQSIFNEEMTMEQKLDAMKKRETELKKRMS